MVWFKNWIEICIGISTVTELSKLVSGWQPLQTVSWTTVSQTQALSINNVLTWIRVPIPYKLWSPALCGYIQVCW